MDRRRLLMFVCFLAPMLHAAETRAEMARRLRKRREDDEWEWKHKYEEQWKAYLDERGLPYKKWNYTKREEKRQFQAHRKSKGLKPLPSRFL